jgi:mycothiol synthase
MDGFVFAETDARVVDEAGLPEKLAFAEAFQRERGLDEPPMSAEEFRAQAASIPAFREVRVWEARVSENDRLAGMGWTSWETEGSDPTVADVTVRVLPEFRRRGLGSALLARLAEATMAAGRTTLTASATASVPAGAAFLERYGATKALEERVSQLRVADVPPSLLDEWAANGPSADFDLVRLDTPVDPEALPEAVEMVNRLLHDIPRGELTGEVGRMTVEAIRAMDAQLHASGGCNWVLVARDRATGRHAGLTMLTWMPQRPYLARQGITGVLPEYRRRGLGRWLKAELLRWTRENRPEVEVVRTNNAEVNAGMLAINEALGFRPYSHETVYQLSAERCPPVG